MRSQTYEITFAGQASVTLCAAFDDCVITVGPDTTTLRAHGEDVKECYFYIDATPTASYLKMLYKYPQAEFPYADLIAVNAARGSQIPNTSGSRSTGRTCSTAAGRSPTSSGRMCSSETAVSWPARGCSLTWGRGSSTCSPCSDRS